MNLFVLLIIAVPLAFIYITLKTVVKTLTIAAFLILVLVVALLIVSHCVPSSSPVVLVLIGIIVLQFIFREKKDK